MFFVFLFCLLFVTAQLLQVVVVCSSCCQSLVRVRELFAGLPVGAEDIMAYCTSYRSHFRKLAAKGLGMGGYLTITVPVPPTLPSIHEGYRYIMDFKSATLAVGGNIGCVWADGLFSCTSKQINIISPLKGDFIKLKPVAGIKLALNPSLHDLTITLLWISWSDYHTPHYHLNPPRVFLIHISCNILYHAKLLYMSRKHAHCTA